MELLGISELFNLHKCLNNRVMEQHSKIDGNAHKTLKNYGTYVFLL